MLLLERTISNCDNFATRKSQNENQEHTAANNAQKEIEK
jgi:hypothetical protein